MRSLTCGWQDGGPLQISRAFSLPVGLLSLWFSAQKTPALQATGYSRHLLLKPGRLPRASWPPSPPGDGGAHLVGISHVRGHRPLLVSNDENHCAVYFVLFFRHPILIRGGSLELSTRVQSTRTGHHEMERAEGVRERGKEWR